MPAFSLRLPRELKRRLGEDASHRGLRRCCAAAAGCGETQHHIGTLQCRPGIRSSLPRSHTPSLDIPPRRLEPAGWASAAVATGLGPSKSQHPLSSRSGLWKPGLLQAGRRLGDAVTIGHRVEEAGHTVQLRLCGNGLAVRATGSWVGGGRAQRTPLFSGQRPSGRHGRATAEDLPTVGLLRDGFGGAGC